MIQSEKIEFRLNAVNKSDLDVRFYINFLHLVALLATLHNKTLCFLNRTNKHQSNSLCDHFILLQ